MGPLSSSRLSSFEVGKEGGRTALGKKGERCRQACMEEEEEERVETVREEREEEEEGGEKCDWNPSSPFSRRCRRSPFPSPLSLLLATCEVGETVVVVSERRRGEEEEI